MKRRWKILTASLLAVGIIGASVMFLAPPETPSVIPVRLPDGSFVNLEAVTYGTNHLVGPRLGQMVNRLPPLLSNFSRRIFGNRASIRFSAQTDSPKVVLWLNRGIMARAFAPGAGYCELQLADTNDFVAGSRVRYGPTYPLEVKEFSAFPRRAPYFVLHIYHHDAAGSVSLCGTMPIKNPIFHQYAQWHPENLPATKLAGEVEVTLEQFHTGLNPVAQLLRSPDDGRTLVFGTNDWGSTNVSACVVRVRPTAKTDYPWRVCHAELSDATGNKLPASKLDSAGLNCFTFEPALWPSENAWKLKLDVVQDAATATNDQFTFHDVPLGAVDSNNRVGRTTNFNGATITLDQIIRKTPAILTAPPLADSASQIIFKTAGLTNGMRMDCVAIVANNGMSLEGSWSSGNDARTNSCWISQDAKTADVTFAVRRAEQVEFLVKPEVSPLRVQLDAFPRSFQ
ncbi:MAG: hypothetical protein RLY20_2313 [Verrucomicrobiota bacterium]|jgi:hypothetical protein